MKSYNYNLKKSIDKSYKMQVFFYLNDILQMHVCESN
jgi:hypothetical protein